MRTALLVSAIVIARAIMLSHGVEIPKGGDFSNGLAGVFFLIVVFDIIDLVLKGRRKN